MTHPIHLGSGAAVAVICSAAILCGCSATSESLRDDPARDSGTEAGAREMLPAETEVWEPEPIVVVPEDAGKAPSDAIVLFDGTDLSAWSGRDGEAAWIVDGGAVTVLPGSGEMFTKRPFGDVQLHIEWRTPAEVSGEGQGRGNSGVYLMGLYEVQVLDSYNNRTYANGQAGAIYKQHIPLVNASRPPGVWQTYDIVFRAPRFDADGRLSAPAFITVLHNGVLIQNHAELAGPTRYIGMPLYRAHAEKLPLMLQDHGNPVSYRNIWIREL
jgi:hypothetical protein